MYPVAQPGFSGATEVWAKKVAAGLAEAGHDVHLVAPDLDEDEVRDGVRYWPPQYHPTRADVVVLFHSVEFAADYAGEALLLASNGADIPGLSPEIAGLVTCFPVLSEVHGKLLCRVNPGVRPERCVVTGIGVDLDDYPPDPVKVPGRIWVGNDPLRALPQVLDVFDLVKKEVPHATLRVTYDFDGQFGRMKWAQNAAAEMLWECKRRLASTPGVTALGPVDRGRLVQEQLAAQVHVWPSDPSNVGTQLHGVSQLEAAAAGCALVLSDVEAFPEVFGEAAEVLPTIGTFVPGADEDGVRVSAEDYAAAVVELMTDPATWAEASKKARRLAEKNTWDDCVSNWILLLDRIGAGVPA